MNESETHFEQLSRLLSLKGREVPPPGYFNGFSSRVIHRIRQGEAAKADGFLARLFEEAPWLLRFIRSFEARPAYAGTIVSVLFLLLVAGIVYSDHPEVATETLMPTTAAATGGSPLAVVTPNFMEQAPSQSADFVSSTNPVLSLDPGASAFGGQNSLLQPVGFTR